MSKISENSLKERIKNLAVEKKVTVNELLKKLYLERFLARLARSKHGDKFIFKGGNLLGYYLEIGRQTMDLDFLLTKLKAEESTVKDAFDEIAQVQSDDGFELKFVRIETLDQAHMSYRGYRVILNIKFIEGKLSDNLQIDVGIGDAVEPESHDIKMLTYKGQAIFEESVSLLVYSAENIYAEKLETVASKGPINSRMKDFHDLILMGRAPGLLNHQQLQTCIVETFQHRGTPLTLPIQFEEQRYVTMNSSWIAHGATSSTTSWWTTNNMPQHFKQVVLEINHFLGSAGVVSPDEKKKP